MRHPSPAPILEPPCDPARRWLLRAAALAPAALLAPRALQAFEAQASAPALPAQRTLSLINTHTGESLTARYCAAGQYVAQALTDLNTLLRDHRRNEVGAIDPKLFDLLHQVAACADCEPHFEVISGYRSPASN